MYLKHYREVLCNRQLLHGVADYSYMYEKKIKVGVVCICLNPPYWNFANEMLWGLKMFFLKHKDIKDKYETEFMLWSDMPETPDQIQQKVAEYLVSRNEATVSVVSSEAAEIVLNENKKKEVNDLIQGV